MRKRVVRPGQLGPRDGNKAVVRREGSHATKNFLPVDDLQILRGPD